MEKLRLSLLVSAYKSNPNKDSESEVGWQWISNLGKHHSITAITKGHEDPGMVRRLIAKYESDVHFEYYNLPKYLKFLEKGNLGHFLYYSLWQIGAFFLARKIIRCKRFDIVQHFVFVNTWQPTYMAFLGIPFVFGPIGENPRIPFGIAKYYGIKVVFKEFIKSATKYMSKNFNPLMIIIYRKAERIIVINKAVYSKMPIYLNNKIIIHPAIGVTLPVGVTNQKEINAKRSLRILYVGRFVYNKGPDIALNAFVKFGKDHLNTEFLMIGGGRMIAILQKLIERNAMSHLVKIYGWLDRNIVLEYMRSSDIFLFPSFEGGGMVVLEAMSLGKPVICLDFGGPGEFITDECGIKIKVTKLSQIINELAGALDKLYASERLRYSMGVAAKKRVNEFYNWREKSNWMNSVYIDLIGKTQERNDISSSINRNKSGESNLL